MVADLPAVAVVHAEHQPQPAAEDDQPLNGNVTVRIVRFAAYREYEQSRTDASNAMMALLAGAQLASHLLQLTEGLDRLLPEVYPRVPHIGRFNLTSDAARRILDAADTHLGAMSVPYALAIHEDFLKTCLALLEQAALCLPGTSDKLPLAQQHAAIESATGGVLNADSLAQLDTLRRMRNCTIHSGGRANASLLHKISNWTASTEAGWVRLARRNPRGLRVGDVVVFGHGELILALAVTKLLGREANQLLQPALPRAQWADMVVDDLLASDPRALASPDASRRVRGLARYHYQPLALTDAELQSAMTRR